MNTFAYIRVFSALLLVGTATGQTSDPTPTPSDGFDCPTGVPDGTTYPDPTDCTKYFVCTNGLAWEEHCPAGLWYDPIRDICDWPETVTCAASPPPTSTVSTTAGNGYTCPGGPDAPDESYPDPVDCTKYYVCTEGVVFPKQCPDGLWYDSITKQCDWPGTAHCEAGPAPSSTISPSSTLVTSSSPSPSTSVTSSDYTELPSTLSTSNPSTVSPSSTVSISSTVSASSTPSTSTSGGGGFTCPPNGADGAAYSDPDDCAKYYVCTGGQAIKEDCAPGLWFDPLIESCNWPEVVNCAASPAPTSTSAPSLFRKFRI